MNGRRDPTVWLDAAEARCEPSALPQCGRFTCARYFATLPVGGTMVDFNTVLNRTHSSGRCPQWLSAEAKAPAQAVSRPVFKSLGG
jgi:hypothetical protein